MSTTLVKEKLTFDEFLAIENKLSIRIGVILTAERVPKSNGLKLTVGFSEGEVKTAFTNLGKYFEPEALIAIKAPFIMNLEPSVIKGVTSEVMIMAAEDELGNVSLENHPIGSKLL